jgi:hypothetical protein
MMKEYIEYPVISTALPENTEVLLGYFEKIYDYISSLKATKKKK